MEKGGRDMNFPVCICKFENVAQSQQNLVQVKGRYVPKWHSIQ